MGLDAAPGELGPLIDAASRVATADSESIDNETRDSARRFLRWIFDNYGTDNPDEEASVDDESQDGKQP